MKTIKNVVLDSISTGGSRSVFYDNAKLCDLAYVEEMIYYMVFRSIYISLRERINSEGFIKCEKFIEKTRVTM
jgi:hypothetical protein